MNSVSPVCCCKILLAGLFVCSLAQHCEGNGESCSHQDDSMTQPKDEVSMLQVFHSKLLGMERSGPPKEEPGPMPPPKLAAPPQVAPLGPPPPAEDDNVEEDPNGEPEEELPDATAKGLYDALGENWENTPMIEYTTQCSHNTYATGVQGTTKVTTSVDVKSMPLSLSLGYRCIEIDVWPRKGGPKDWAKVEGGFWPGPAGGPAGDTPAHSLMKVTHHEHAVSGKDVLNNLDLTIFIQAILDWLERDEQAHPASEHAPKMPIVISIENRANDKATNPKKIPIPVLENYLHHIFSWLDFNTAGSVNRRIVREGEFGGKDGKIGVAVAKTGPRKIVLKSKLYSAPDDSQLHDIIAMKDLSDDRFGHGDLRSKSIDMDLCGVGTAKQDKISTYVDEGAMVRTFPNGLAIKSGNYDPSGAFAKRANMICVNFQGQCATSYVPMANANREGKCTNVARGKIHGESCTCKRDVSASLENLFLKHGYDGYINYNVVKPDELAAYRFNVGSWDPACSPYRAANSVGKKATAAAGAVKSAAVSTAGAVASKAGAAKSAVASCVNCAKGVLSKGAKVSP